MDSARQPKLEVIKHSAAIQVPNMMTHLQRRSWNILLANAYDDLPKGKVHHMRVADLIEDLGISTNNDEHIKELIIALQDMKLEFNLLGKDKKGKWGRYQVLGSVEIEHGVIHYGYDPVLSRLLYRPEMYSRIQISIQNKLRGKHAAGLYENLFDYRGVGTTGWIEILKFYELMGSDPKDAPAYGYFKRDVLNPALKEINKKTDIRVTLKEQKQGRRVAAVAFMIKEKAVEEARAGKPEVPKQPQKGGGDRKLADDDVWRVYEGLPPLIKSAVEEEAKRSIKEWAAENDMADHLRREGIDSVYFRQSFKLRIIGIVRERHLRQV